MNEKPKTARSYRGNVIDDNLVLSFNFKFLVNILLVGGSILYGWFSLQQRITKLEEKILLADRQIRGLLDKHMETEREERLMLEKEVGFLQKKLNVNPFSWKWRDK